VIAKLHCGLSKRILNPGNTLLVGGVSLPIVGVAVLRL
jgi:hypothetical protein